MSTAGGWRPGEGHTDEERIYRLIFETSPDGIAIVDPDFVITAANPQSAILLGYNGPVDLIGRNLIDFIASEDRQSAAEGFRRVFKTGSVEGVENRLLKRDGSRVVVEGRATLVTGPQGNPEFIIAVAHDITAHKHIEKALRESEAKYRDLYDNAPDMYHSLDRNGVIIQCNETEARMLGYEKEEIIGRPLTDFFTEESRKLFERDFPRLNYEKRMLNIQREFVRKDGSTFLANLNIFSEYDEDNNLTGTKAIARDITDLKKLEAEFLKSQKLESIGILAGGIAHDFNNILTAIVANINLARAEMKEGDPLFKRLSEAEIACASASKLTQQLLTFSRGGKPIKKAVSLPELIRNCASLALTGSNVKCGFSFAGDLLPVEADEGQIGQAVNNLVLNAAQSMPGGGAINICAVNDHIGEGLSLTKGMYVKVTIEDHGAGISGEHLEKIFDLYFTTKEKGSGLGLSITYSIIKNHGGQITVKSSPGSGTTFTIHLPASEKSFPAIRTSEERFVRGKGRVLLMDDEEMVRNVGGDILAHVGYEVEFAKDGDEALEVYRKSFESGIRFDIVILDLTVPGGMGGKETIRAIKEMDPQVKAIASSGYYDDPVMARFGDYGFANVIPKPYKGTELSKIVYEVLMSGNPGQ